LADVKLAAYDLLGREVVRLLDTSLASGFHEEKLYVKDLAPGVYLLKLQSGGMVTTSPLVVLR
jgi:hypothetical protein